MARTDTTVRAILLPAEILSNTHQARIVERNGHHTLACKASEVSTNVREMRVNSLFPQATWGSCVVDVRRLPLIDTHINQLASHDQPATPA
ncbi:hypothetical protein [Streptomyces sp. NBC_01361]|uniref:hypothetical protein n=1 Tax=Streptomyces sp. NBC_01361 TaxID=2903838 RepID=UPI002E32609B|nr:hypothetical protein [Streptomyces sp. NBC_01361]